MKKGERKTPQQQADYLMQHCPKQIAEEIREWFSAAICGHGSSLSPKAKYYWKRFLVISSKIP